MALKSGFFNSKNRDRVYDADTMGSIFDGIIRDGIYYFYKDALAVDPGDGLSVSVKSGRAWFMHTWTENTSALTLRLDAADLIQNRIDAVVLEVDKRTTVRNNTIKIVKGPKAVKPVRPTLVNELDHRQYPLAWIYVAANAKAVARKNITDARGTTDTPWVTAPLHSVDATKLYERFQDAFDTWFRSTQSGWTKSASDMQNAQSAAFNEWFARIKSTLDGNQIGALTNRITELENHIGNAQHGTTIYHSIQDSSGRDVLDSSNRPIQAHLVYTVAN